MKNIIKSILALISIPILFTSCMDEPDIEKKYPESAFLVIRADIAGTGKKTRAAIADSADMWSYVGFESGDIMGFYSSGGNWLEDQGKGDFNNLKLEYDAANNQFTDLTNGVEFSPTQMSGSKTYMYFPYDDNMYTTGMELRRTKQDDPNTLRCIDLLSSNTLELQGVVDNKKVALYGTFDHGFSELIIIRGEGFNNPPPGLEEVRVVVQKPFTNIKINVTGSGDTWSLSPELYFDPDNSHGLTSEEAQVWKAWRGGNYGQTVLDTVGRPAYYVVIPTIGSQEGKKKDGERTLVEYVELYDNEGYLQRVTSLRLSGANTKYVDAGWRYPMEISMKELVPTVNPFRIVPWNDDVNITDQRTRGINDLVEFTNFVQEYNSYLLAPEDQDKIDALFKYGDLYVNEQTGKYWHFYLLQDLDLSNYKALEIDGVVNDETVILPQFADILDGLSTDLVNGKFLNHKISGLNRTFIGNLSGSNAQLQNIDFVEPRVRTEVTTPIGILSRNIINGTIANCNIEDGNLIAPNCSAGMISGTMEGGLVKDCTIEGFLVAKGTGSGDARYIIGTDPTGSASLVGNNNEAVVGSIN